MLRKLITERAKAHMNDIKRFTKNQWGTAQSVKYLQEISNKIGLLAQRPQIGIDRSGDCGDGIRSYFAGSHTIYYRYDAELLVVYAILHQSMMPQAHLTSNED
jgi:toxin ParE1/3/4